MSDLAARPSIAPVGLTYRETVSTPLALVPLFCLLGLAISAALLPLFASEEISWVISHLE